MKFVLIATSLLQAAEAEHCTGAECVESATMLQTSGKKKKAPIVALQERSQQRSSQVDSLYDSAVKMLREGATPEVVTFSTEALSDISGPVKQAIHDAHYSDIQRMNEMFPRFNEIIGNYTDHTIPIIDTRTINQGKSDAHRECRRLQSGLYYDHKECREEEWSKWVKFTEETNDLNDLFTNNHCVVPHTNVSSDAVTNVDKEPLDTKVAFEINAINTKVAASITAINTQHQITQEAWKAHNEQWVSCNKDQKELDDKKDGCDTEQTELEEAVCLNHQLHRMRINEAQREWDLQMDSWKTLTGAIKDEEGYRKNEYVALHEVQCLLEKIRERGGKPCDETLSEKGDEADLVISHCRGEIVDISNLTIHVPPVNVALDFLEDEPYPCNDDYEQKHYSFKAGTLYGLESDERAPFSYDPSFTWTDENGKKRVSEYMPECQHNCVVPAPVQQAVRVACENPGHPTFSECTMAKTGTCNGKARLGYGDKWSAWKDITTDNGVFDCTNGFFGGDPIKNQAKECVCITQAAPPTTTTMEEAYPVEITTTTATTTTTEAEKDLATALVSVPTLTDVKCLEQSTHVTSFTVDMYITENSFRENGERFYASQWTDQAHGWAIRINKKAAGYPFLEFFVCNGGGWTRAAMSVTDSEMPAGVEFRLTATYDGEKATIYKDGVLGPESDHFVSCCGMTNPKTLQFTDAPEAQLCIGHDCRSGIGHAKDFDFSTGQIRDFAFHSVALTF